jgi:AcrR family transcriptional regulator
MRRATASRVPGPTSDLPRNVAASQPGGEATTAKRLLATAAKLFRSKGYAASTTRELASLLGIQKATLYHHVRSKEDLLFSISVESLRRITEAVGGVVAAASPEERLRSMICTHLETALRDRDFHTTMLVELRALSPELRAQIIDRRDRYQRLVERVIAEQQEAGVLRNDIDAHYLTLSLLNLLNWTIFWFEPGGDKSASDLGEMMASIFLEGAAA